VIVLDSYAWVEHFAGTDKGETVRACLAEGALSPSIVLAEVARKYLREGFRREDVVKRLAFITARSDLQEINVDIALAASEAYDELSFKAEREKIGKPSLADGIVLATARWAKLKLISGDRHFKGLPEVVYIGE